MLISKQNIDYQIEALICNYLVQSKYLYIYSSSFVVICLNYQTVGIDAVDKLSLKHTKSKFVMELLNRPRFLLVALNDEDGDIPNGSGVSLQRKLQPRAKSGDDGRFGNQKGTYLSAPDKYRQVLYIDIKTRKF